MPNLPAVNNIQESKQKPSEIGDFPSFQVHERAVSCPNLVLLENSSVEALLETECKSTPNIILPAVNDIRENGQKPLENFDFHSLPVHCKRSVSLPNMALGANCSGDAPEIGWPLVKSAELPAVTIDSPCTETSIATLMTPAAAPVEDSGIETSSSVVSSSLLRLQKVEADLRLMVTDTDPAVTADTPKRPRWSLWNRTKKFVRTNVLVVVRLTPQMYR
ncbi:unnamed protein product [Macrosiphum euphorbiae]|uniref:Uncharacterized protein n=1 Tax=Macrosiphum euphorbiae TaxID=13131 RepID=A0AAV0X5G0_9HEMI|nr:unnamed protein product [Macrosiphum euphorbiae]